MMESKAKEPQIKEATLTFSRIKNQGAKARDALTDTDF
jgi:hypothetical protein